MRQEAKRCQEKIEHLLSVFITPKYIGANIKNISVVDNVRISTDAISEHLSGNALEFKDNIIQNVSFITKSKDYSVMANLGLLVEDKKESMAGVSGMVKQLGDNCKVGYENRTKNLVISENNITGGFENFTNNCKLFWMQANKNVNQLVDYISMKIERSK